MGNRLVVNPVTRIEGHARIVIDVDDGGQVAAGHLEVLEIRGFEKLLQGMELFKMPQMTGRLCGVCPAAHHLASVVAIEHGLGITVPEAARQLRELLYAGHLLHSHALSAFVLTGPDVLVGLDEPANSRSVFSLLRLDPELAQKILRVRSIGQRVVEIVGGRGVHPVTAVPGGMAARPDAERLELIAGWGWEAVQLLEEIGARLCQKLPELDQIREVITVPYHSLALSKNGEHSMLDGEWVVLDAEGTEERRFAGSDYGDHLVEHVMPGSYMKSVRLRSAEEKHFFVGPLARLNVNTTMSTDKANEALDAFRSQGVPRLSALDNISARLIEMFHFSERMATLAGNIDGGDLRVPAEPQEGRHVGAIEAPRGILVHDYTTDGSGHITACNLIVATQNNYDAIDSAITSLAQHFLPQGDDDRLLNGVEFTLRCFDPCLACATHQAGRMPLSIEIRNGSEVLRKVARRGSAS